MQRVGKGTLNVVNANSTTSVHSTAKHKLLLHFTTYDYIPNNNTTVLDSEQDYANILSVYRSVID